MTSRPTLLSAALLLLAVYLGTASAGKDDASAPFMKKIDLGKFDAENPFSDVMLEINPADDVSARALAGIEKTEEEEADILNEMAYRRERMLINFTAKVKTGHETFVTTQHGIRYLFSSKRYTGTGLQPFPPLVANAI